MAALIAADAREHPMKVTTVEKAFEDLGPNLSISHDLTAKRDEGLREICGDPLCSVMHGQAITAAVAPVTH